MDTAPAAQAQQPAARILVSACLLGSRVRFDGRAKTVDDAIIDRWRAERRLVPHCPEVAGGLPVPRPPAEIEPGSDARAVLEGRGRILTPQGEDVTAYFLTGARAALDTARSHGVCAALLKESSPSCGLHQVYDGTFSGRTTTGSGITALLLQDHGIAVFPETALPAADTHLRSPTPALAHPRNPSQAGPQMR